MNVFAFALLIVLFCFNTASAFRVKSVEQFMSNAALDAWDSSGNEVLFLRKDGSGILQVFKVKEDSKDPESEKVCLSCDPVRVIGSKVSSISSTHKGSSDWHPSGQWFITTGEIPENIGWKMEKRKPGARRLAEPGSGWWNNLFLVSRDGKVWIKLTDFTAKDINCGILSPKFSRDGKLIAWSERIGGAKPFDLYPFGRWVLKTARISTQGEQARLYDIKLHPSKDGAFFEPQGWSTDGKLLFSADLGYAELPYPAYRLDLWEAELDKEGSIQNLVNLTGSKGFYEEHASYSPAGQFIALGANYFDLSFEKVLDETWKRDRQRQSHVLGRKLTTDLFLMTRGGMVLQRITHFADQDWKGKHPRITRSAWSRDRKVILVGAALHSNVTGKKEEELIYRIRLEESP